MDKYRESALVSSLEAVMVGSSRRELCGGAMRSFQSPIAGGRAGMSTIGYRL